MPSKVSLFDANRDTELPEDINKGHRRGQIQQRSTRNSAKHQSLPSLTTNLDCSGTRDEYIDEGFPGLPAKQEAYQELGLRSQSKPQIRDIGAIVSAWILYASQVENVAKLNTNTPFFTRWSSSLQAERSIISTGDGLL